MSAPIRTACGEGVLTVTLARPPVNALDGALIAALDATVGAASADDAIRVLHLRSDERAFCAGADLALMRDCFERPAGVAAMLDVVRAMQRLFARLEAAPLVTLAEINTSALGGGFELALACDLRIAAVEARVGLPEARLGLVPGAGGTQRLTRLAGPGVARRLILGGEVLDGAAAERLGLVHWARPQTALGAFAREQALRSATVPKAAIAAAKRCIAAALDPARDGYADEIAATALLYEQAETRRLVSAFLGKSTRQPH